MARKWNGKLVDNTHAGDAVATIVMDFVSIPCAVIVTIWALWWVYTAGAPWPFYLAALIGGPIGGFFAAAAIGLGTVAILVVLALVFLPFKAGYDRYSRFASLSEGGDDGA